MSHRAIFQHLSKEIEVPIFVKAFEYKFFDFTYHYHPEYEIMLIENGSGKQIVGNTISNYENNSLLFLGKNLAHGWKETKKLETDLPLTQCVYIQFGENCLGNDFFTSPETIKAKELLQQSGNGLQIFGKCMEEISGIMKEMVTQRGLKKVISLLRIFDTLISNPDYRVLCDDQYQPLKGGKRDKRIQEIYQYLFENLNEDIQLDTIAKKMGMSKSSFCHFFKKYEGRSFSTRLTQLRVKQACHYLQNTNFPITRICYECGFQSISYFNKSFKEITHMSPTRYRNEFTIN